MNELTKKPEEALVPVEEEVDNRSIPEVLQDVHLVNLGLKARTWEEQIADRWFLQECLACWSIQGINCPLRGRIEKVLNERYWLIGDEVTLRKKAKPKPKAEEEKFAIAGKKPFGLLT
jgi:hypothetical protein